MDTPQDSEEVECSLSHYIWTNVYWLNPKAPLLVPFLTEGGVDWTTTRLIGV